MFLPIFLLKLWTKTIHGVCKTARVLHQSTTLRYETMKLRHQSFTLSYQSTALRHQSMSLRYKSELLRHEKYDCFS